MNTAISYLFQIWACRLRFVYQPMSCACILCIVHIDCCVWLICSDVQMFFLLLTHLLMFYSPLLIMDILPSAYTTVWSYQRIDRNNQKLPCHQLWPYGMQCNHIAIPDGLLKMKSCGVFALWTIHNFLAHVHVQS